MTEKQFLKLINGKLNNEKHFTYNYLLAYIEQGKKDLAPTKPTGKIRNFLKNTFGKKEKHYAQVLRENLDLIIDKTHEQYMCTVLKRLLEVPELGDDMRQNLVPYLERLNAPFEKSDFLRDFIQQSDDNLKFAENNLEEILLSDNQDYVFDYSQIMKKTSEETKKKTNEVLLNNKLKVARRLLERSMVNVSGMNEKDIEDYTLTLSTLIVEVVQNENCDYTDITEIGHGSYSYAYSIGEKVLKVGKPRVTYKIPNHRRILAPLLRINFTAQQSGETFSCVEIVEKVERFRGNIEELYEVYKELREAGIEFPDCRPDNFGVLKKDNVAHWNYDLQVHSGMTGIEGSVEGETLKAGDIVILDSDYLYLEGEPNMEKVNNAPPFKEWYDKEKASSSQFDKSLKGAVISEREIKAPKSMQKPPEAINKQVRIK